MNRKYIIDKIPTIAVMMDGWCYGINADILVLDLSRFKIQNNFVGSHIHAFIPRIYDQAAIILSKELYVNLMKEAYKDISDNSIGINLRAYFKAEYSEDKVILSFPKDNKNIFFRINQEKLIN